MRVGDVIQLAFFPLLRKMYFWSTGLQKDNFIIPLFMFLYEKYQLFGAQNFRSRMRILDMEKNYEAE
jgi:hypothetical protein